MNGTESHWKTIAKYSVRAELVARDDHSDARCSVSVHYVPAIRAAWVSAMFDVDNVIEPDGVLDIEAGHQDDQEAHSEMRDILSEHGWTLA